MTNDTIKTNCLESLKIISIPLFFGEFVTWYMNSRLKKQLRNMIIWILDTTFQFKILTKYPLPQQIQNTSALILHFLYVVFTVYNVNLVAPLRDTQKATTINYVFGISKKDRGLLNDTFNFWCLTNWRRNQEWPLEFQRRKRGCK